MALLTIGKRKYRLNKKRIILLLLILVLPFLGITIAIRLIPKEGYNDEGSFNRYGTSYFKGISGERQVGTASENFTYGESLSHAVQIPSMDNKRMDESIRSIVTDETKDFQNSKKSPPPNGKAALLIGYESYETPEEVESVALHVCVREEDSHQKVKTASKVVPCNFAKKSGLLLYSPQIFAHDHTAIYREEAKKQLEKEYGDALKKDKARAEKIIDAEADNFLMTDKGFKFYYSDPMFATEKEKAKGKPVTVSVEIPYKTFQSVMRQDIGKRSIDPDKPMVALTYDDGPHGTFTPQLLDIYEENQAACTFFELGTNVDNVKGSGDILKRQLSLGCEIGSHSYSHPNLHVLSPQAIKNEADRASAAIEKACGEKPTVFRPPYGNGSSEIASIFDLPSVNWTVDTMDWSSKNKDAIVSHVKSQGNLDGQIILLHSVYQSSVDASAELVPWLISQGYQPVTVTELFQYKYGSAPKKGVDYGYLLAPPES